MTFLKYIAAISNIGLVCIFSFLWITEGGPVDEEILWVIFLFAYLFINFYLTITYPSGKDWLSLRFQRKALEEEIAIKNLHQSEKKD